MRNDLYHDFDFRVGLRIRIRTFAPDNIHWQALFLWMFASLALRNLRFAAIKCHLSFKRAARASFGASPNPSPTLKLSALPFASLGASLTTSAASGIKSTPSMAEMGMLGWLGVDIALNLIGWAYSAVKKTEMYYDMVGTGSFLTLTLGSLFLSPGPLTVKKALVSGMVGVWAARLGSYLVQRIHHVGTDKRFDGVKDKPATFLVYWMMQSLWVFATLSPVLIINLSKSSPALSLIDLPGIALFVLGLSAEAIADQQKAAFREKPENKGRYINEGLWSVSRHPNYVGEVCLWAGVFLTSASSFTKASHWGSIASPLFVFGLIRYRSLDISSLIISLSLYIAHQVSLRGPDLGEERR